MNCVQVFDPSIETSALWTIILHKYVFSGGSRTSFVTSFVILGYSTCVPQFVWTKESIHPFLGGPGRCYGSFVLCSLCFHAVRPALPATSCSGCYPLPPHSRSHPHTPTREILIFLGLILQLEPERRLGMRVGFGGQHTASVADGGKHLRRGGRER